MARTLLVHGFATGIRYSVFRGKRGPDAGFLAFAADVKAGTMKVFRWDIQEDASFSQSVNPWYSWNVYRRELERALDPAWQKQLHAALMDEQPETIVCHSLGCRFLLEMVRRFGIPGSVKRIVFLQADVPVSATLPPLPVTWFNLYCPWDPSLLASSIVNRDRRAGLLGWRVGTIKNVFCPLIRPWNIHTASIRSPRTRRWLARIV